ncbi:MAG: GNAT family N-acetyltransferase [Candidatus Ruminococcus intestinipullorum]|nr:GNAT family N-acetyltransferase [Candidatus Ruminococcus intestinipullorum]
MAIPLYIRKEYYRGVNLSDKSAHILEFHYKGQNVDVYENGVCVFHLEYAFESKFRVNLLNFYVPDFTLRGRGYGTVCMLEILSQFRKKQVTMVKSPLGYQMAPLGYTGPEQYHRLIEGFFLKTGFSISGNGDMALQIIA